MRDWWVELKSLSEKGLLHIGVVKAPVCNAAGQLAGKGGGMTVGPAVNLSASWFVYAMRLEVCS